MCEVTPSASAEVISLLSSWGFVTLVPVRQMWADPQMYAMFVLVMRRNFSFPRSDLTPDEKKPKKRKWKKKLHVLKVCWKQKHEQLNESGCSQWSWPNEWPKEMTQTSSIWPNWQPLTLFCGFKSNTDKLSMFTYCQIASTTAAILLCTKTKNKTNLAGSDVQEFFGFFFIRCVGTGFAFHLNVLSWLLMLAGCEQASCRLFIRLLAGAFGVTSSQRSALLTQQHPPSTALFHGAADPGYSYFIGSI